MAEPPESYLRSHELAVIQKDAISEEDLSFIFSHGQPLVFEACPDRLVPKLIEAFQELSEEPSFLQVTIMCGSVGRIEVSPPLYDDYYPCTACRRFTTVQTRYRPEVAAACSDANMKCVVEKFHICSKHFTKQLSFELYSKFWSPIKVLVRVEDPVCGVAAVTLSKSASRTRTLMLVPEFAVEVFGFVDRVHIGSSLLANRRIQDCLNDTKGILPVHLLSCELRRDSLGYDSETWQHRYSTYYRLVLHHFQRDLPYNDAREFKLCDVMTSQEECALALRYLSNSYIVVFGSHHANFFLRMLGALGGRNVTVGRVTLSWFGACVRDYRALERAFGGQLPITSLRLSLGESSLVGLAKVTDFFRYPGVQCLKELCLSLVCFWKR
ncbi:hypothetical protein AAVH_23875 [Aphelenchoides avenae]|nr:hypothetical protein AAVH_23875 [Aphelenchus avenae]